MVDPSTPPKYGASQSVTEDGFERVSGVVSAPLRVFLVVSIAFSLAAVPFLTWGASARLLQDARDVAPPFSCGPCVTRECALSEARGGWKGKTTTRVSAATADTRRTVTECSYVAKTRSALEPSPFLASEKHR